METGPQLGFKKSADAIFAIDVRCQHLLDEFEDSRKSFVENNLKITKWIWIGFLRRKKVPAYTREELEKHMEEYPWSWINGTLNEERLYYSLVKQKQIIQEVPGANWYVVNM